MTATTPCRSHISRPEVRTRAIVPVPDIRPKFLLSIVVRLPFYGFRNAAKPCFVECELDLRGRGLRAIGFVVAADGGAGVAGAAEYGAGRPVDHLL